MISIIGCGRLGAPYAAAMAQMGHHVLGLDTDPATIRLLRAGSAPFGEPGLHEATARHTRAGNLRFTSSYDEAAVLAGLHIMCVGTPQQAGGLAIDLHDLRQAVAARRADRRARRRAGPGPGGTRQDVRCRLPARQRRRRRCAELR